MTPTIAEDEDLELEEEVEEDEAPISFDIASYPSDLTLSVVKEMWDNGDIEIPEYQRNFVWTIKQSSLLVESFLLGLPVPQVFFYVDATNKNQVIDGQQRIVSIASFLDGHFGQESIHGKKQVFRLTGLNPRSPFAKKRFADLSEADQRKFRSAVLRAINIRQLHPKGAATSVYHIFERLNTGGTPLRPQEIRNCVFLGDFVRILRDLNANRDWRSILGKTTFDKHQKDVELLLRVFALAEHFPSYDKPMKEFLNRVMSEERSGSSERVSRFAAAFPRVAERIVNELGPKPFHIRGPMNASALDAVFATLVRKPSSIPVDLADRYAALRENDEFQKNTYYGTSDRAVVLRRFAVAEEHLFA
jgi:hypothetical protein